MNGALPKELEVQVLLWLDVPSWGRVMATCRAAAVLCSGAGGSALRHWMEAEFDRRGGAWCEAERRRRIDGALQRHALREGLWTQRAAGKVRKKHIRALRSAPEDLPPQDVALIVAVATLLREGQATPFEKAQRLLFHFDFPNQLLASSRRHIVTAVRSAYYTGTLADAAHPLFAVTSSAADRVEQTWDAAPEGGEGASTPDTAEDDAQPARTAMVAHLANYLSLHRDLQSLDAGMDFGVYQKVLARFPRQ